MKKLLFSLFILPIALFAQEPEALKIGSKAPAFSGITQNKEAFVSAEAINNGPLIVMFYRGQWCPYCTRQLKEMQDSLGLISEFGASVVAITPEKPENVEKSLDKSGAEFPVIFDEGHKIMDAFKVSFSEKGEKAERYKKWMEGGLEGAHGNKDNTLPVPATYIIDKDGLIRYAYFNPKYSERANVSDLIKALKEM